MYDIWWSVSCDYHSRTFLFLFCYRFMCQRPTIFKFKSFTSSFFKYDHTIDVPLSKVIHLCSINMRILSKNIKSVNHLLCRNIYDKTIGSVWQGFRFTEFGFISLDSPKKFPNIFSSTRFGSTKLVNLEARFTNFVKLLKRCSTEFRFTVDLIHGESQIQIHFL
jgi:hypothetical protein